MAYLHSTDVQFKFSFTFAKEKKRDKSAVLKPYSLYTVKSIEMYEFLLQRLDLLRNIRVGNYQTQFVQFCLKGFLDLKLNPPRSCGITEAGEIAGNLMMNEAIPIPLHLHLFAFLSSLLTYLVPTQPITV